MRGFVALAALQSNGAQPVRHALRDAALPLAALGLLRVRQPGRPQPGKALECIFIHVDTGDFMDLQIAKWGNSLALRIPSTIVRQLKLRDGDIVRAQLMADGALSIRPPGWSRASFAAELEHARSALPMGSTVIDEIRQRARY